MAAYERVLETVFGWETKWLLLKWLLTGSGHLWEVVTMRELSECILSTLLGSFILTWTIHEVYCHSKMMNVSVDVLVYHVLVLFQKKEKEKEASPKVWGSRAPQFSPIATCTVICHWLAAGWLVHMSLACPRGRRMLAQGDCIMGGTTLRISLRSEVGEFNKTKSPGSITDLKSFHLWLFTIFFSLMM